MYNSFMKLSEIDYRELDRFDSAFKRDCEILAGLDEAGRGPLAGPVVAAAVILERPVKGVYDSKALCAETREKLFEEIMANAKVGIGLATPEEIDLLNILKATRLAMNRALDCIPLKPSYVIIDGKHLNLNTKGRCIVGGDRLSASIASASIIAKVFRDKLMRELATLYPEYGYDKHKGYGTRAHLEAIEKYGPSTWHRFTYRPVRLSVKAELISSWLKCETVNEARLSRAGLLFPEVAR